MKYKIDKNIPLHRRCKYPFLEMEVGDSIFVPNRDVPASGAYSAASYFTFRHPEYRFAVRKSEGGFRIWRIESNE